MSTLNPMRNAIYLACLMVCLSCSANMLFRAARVDSKPAAIPEIPSYMADEASEPSDVAETTAESTESIPPVIGEAAKRSPKWKSLRAKHIKAHPRCEACGTFEDLDVHHVRPFHIAPELALDPANLITLCRRHHFEIGHRGDWDNENPNVWKDAARFKAKHPWK